MASNTNNINSAAIDSLYFPFTVQISQQDATKKKILLRRLE
jgi:hypothetical protein